MAGIALSTGRRKILIGFASQSVLWIQKGLPYNWILFGTRLYHSYLDLWSKVVALEVSESYFTFFIIWS